MDRMTWRYMCAGFTFSAIIGAVILFAFPSRLFAVAVAIVAFAAAETGYRGR